MARQAELSRKTKETDISVSLNLDGQGKSNIATGIGFFDHLLDALTRHAAFDLTVNAKGDLHIDGHHTVEDVGIVLGQVFAQTVGNAAGITRFGSAFCPLDEALARSVVDICGRGFLHYDCALSSAMVGEFDSELFPEFLRAFAINAKITLHVSLLYGDNRHHALEAMIKSVARALRMAVSPDDRLDSVPSTKGVLI